MGNRLVLRVRMAIRAAGIAYVAKEIVRLLINLHMGQPLTKLERDGLQGTVCYSGSSANCINHARACGRGQDWLCDRVHSDQCELGNLCPEGTSCSNKDCSHVHIFRRYVWMTGGYRGEVRADIYTESSASSAEGH